MIIQKPLVVDAVVFGVVKMSGGGISVQFDRWPGEKPVVGDVFMVAVRKADSK